MKILALLLLLFSGCSLIGSKPEPVKPVEVVMAEIKQPTYHPPLPAPGTFRKFEWKVWTSELMKEYIEALERNEAPPLGAQYSLSPMGYENLSYSIADVKRYIVQLQSVVKYYRSLDQKDENTEKETVEK